MSGRWTGVRFGLRNLLKVLVVAIGALAVSPLIALCWIESRLDKGELVFGACAQLLALIPSHLGVILRGAFYLGTLERCSWETHIGFGSLFMHRGAVVAANVSTGSYCVLGHADIGSGVMMGSRVSIPSGKRQHFGDRGQIIAAAKFDTVRIGARTWVGEGAIILADVGQDCVVSAGAVITKSTPDRCIVGGNPAHVLKELNPNRQTET